MIKKELKGLYEYNICNHYSRSLDVVIEIVIDERGFLRSYLDFKVSLVELVFSGVKGIVKEVNKIIYRGSDVEFAWKEYNRVGGK